MDFKLICDVCSKLQDSPPVVTEADVEQIIKTLKNNNASDGCGFHRGSTVGFLLLQCSSGVVRHPRDLQVSVATRFCRVLIFASS